VKRRFFAALALALSLSSPALAATKPPIVITALAPTLTTNFSGGDQVASMALANGAIYLTGTVENATSPLISSPALGGSDGYVVALAPNGLKKWELRLGTAGDDVATAICVDLIGNLWIAGASAVASSSPAPGLNRITVWEVSADGALENTYTKDVADPAVPTQIAAKGANFLIQGSSSKVGSPTFAATLNPAGKIGSLNYGASKAVSPTTQKSVSSAVYAWQSFVTTQGIKGLSGIPPHQSTTVLTRTGLKDRVLKGVNSVTGTPLALQYQSGTGVALLTEGNGTYYLTIIHTK